VDIPLERDEGRNNFCQGHYVCGVSCLPQRHNGESQRSRGPIRQKTAWAGGGRGVLGEEKGIELHEKTDTNIKGRGKEERQHKSTNSIGIRGLGGRGNTEEKSGPELRKEKFEAQGRELMTHFKPAWLINNYRRNTAEERE